MSTMSKSSAPQRQKQNASLNFQQEQQRTNEGFLRRLITKANEHSKKLTIIDTVIYVFLMIALIAVMIIWPHIADYCVDAMGYVTTAFVAVRLGYSAKGAVENFMKIKSNMTSQGVSSIVVEETTSEEETLG